MMNLNSQLGPQLRQILIIERCAAVTLSVVLDVVDIDVFVESVVYAFVDVEVLDEGVPDSLLLRG